MDVLASLAPIGLLQLSSLPISAHRPCLLQAGEARLETT